MKSSQAADAKKPLRVSLSVSVKLCLTSVKRNNSNTNNKFKIGMEVCHEQNSKRWQVHPETAKIIVACLEGQQTADAPARWPCHTAWKQGADELRTAWNSSVRQDHAVFAGKSEM